MRLLITDLTEMGEGMRCVAGWDIDNHRMVRPLPGGSNWSTQLIQAHQLSPGVIVEFTQTVNKHPGSFPHTTEDTEVLEDQIAVVDRGSVDWVGNDGPNAATTLQAAFGGAVQNTGQFAGAKKGLYITAGTEVCSLGAINIQRTGLTLITDSFPGEAPKLKAVINDGQESYRLSVSSHALKAAFAQGGLPAAKAALPTAQILHVRLGLARPFPDAQEKCNLMLNGVHG